MHPYSNLPDRQYWKRASARWASGDFSGVYSPKFLIDKATPIATAGSCFAQHVARNLKNRGYKFLDLEPPPSLLPPDLHAEFGYGLFSARYGNIYTTRQLAQLLRAVHGGLKVEEVWETRGRFFDPLRPRIEPGGFGSAEEVLRLRESHFAAVRRLLRKTEVFVFTLGLTEVWLNRSTGLAYPTCPGTVAGCFDAGLHELRNLSFSEVSADLEWIFAWWRRKVNPNIKFLLTVSPVPLAATAEPQHVVTSTTYSKSVLRAVAGELCQRYEFVDYFPSFELVTSHLGKGAAYARDMREVRPEAVEKVMRAFFSAHGDDEGEVAAATPKSSPVLLEDVETMRAMRVICEEAELDRDAR